MRQRNRYIQTSENEGEEKTLDNESNEPTTLGRGVSRMDHTKLLSGAGGVRLKRLTKT